MAYWAFAAAGLSLLFTVNTKKQLKVKLAGEDEALGPDWDEPDEAGVFLHKRFIPSALQLA